MSKFEKIFPSGGWCVEESVGYLLARSRTKLAKAVDIELAQHDITHAQGSMLLMLSSGNCSTAAELSRELYIDSASITRMIDRLEKRGLIVRMPRGDDRRVIHLQLTEVGAELAARLPDLYMGVLSHHFADFTVDEVATLKTLLRKLLFGSSETAGKDAKAGSA
ncbi:putative transcription regulators (MarR family) [Herminiimonas arsenicoxydans]|uniref:Transcription regulators (MarR family) n=1 Tax=Herminiimonas arsenicoxydans TaxID=204773 RepID=A4G3S8_HERAR|nr:putative transcription regulators (MarR family) [Herminiimonas arsenicoxydans]